MLIQIRLFGAYRQLETAIISLEVDAPVTIKAIKEALQENLISKNKNLASLVIDSAIADEDSVLSDQYLVEEEKLLAILPPVCGG